MRGGDIHVRGSVGDWACAEMRGGILRVDGQAAGYAPSHPRFLARRALETLVGTGGALLVPVIMMKLVLDHGPRRGQPLSSSSSR
ncbi:MAG TPA: hypothetical protein VHQ69_10125 [Methylomirabilota bacterium]|jgi:formylmethanofuran dehydrogenase subunit C|nr:hypothetical protein [Methylomirabilota bacterium]